MRNLKRALSLTLASIMLLGMMVVGSSAASYQDVTDEHNVEAIEVLQAVGIMVGDEGNFNPEKNVTRNEMAVIMSNLMDYRVASYSGTSPFTDVPAWAEPYVAACYTNGITSGTSATTYNGSGNVTTAQAALMVMKALGYFQVNSDFKDDWQLATTRQANSIDLLVGVKAGVKEAMTRNDVAQLVLNGLESGTVELDDSNNINISVGGEAVAINGSKYDLVTSTRDYARSINPDASTTNYTDANASVVELGEKLYNGDLTKKAWEKGNVDDFGRPADHWEYQGKSVGTYTKDEDFTFTKSVTNKTLYNSVGSAACDYTWYVYVDGNRQLATTEKNPDGTDKKDANGDVIYKTDDNGRVVYGDFGSLVSANKTDDNNEFLKKDVPSLDSGLRTGNGVLTQVYVDGTRKTVKVSVIHYYAAEVLRVNNDGDADRSVTLSNLDKNGGASTSHVFETADFAADDIVVYSFAANAIQEIFPAEKLEGKVTQARAYENVTDTTDNEGDHFTVDGTVYKYNKTVSGGSPRRLLTENVNNNMVGYLDQFGYVAYIDDAAASYDYAFVLTMGSKDDEFGGLGGRVSGGVTVYARLVLTDGTVVKAETDQKDKSLEGHIVSYSVDSKGVYALHDQSTNTKNTTGKIGEGSVKIDTGAAGVRINGSTFTANNNTVFILADRDEDDPDEFNFRVYTGIKNVPDVESWGAADKLTTYSVAAEGSNGVAKVIYIEDASVSGTKNIIFIRADKSAKFDKTEGNSRNYVLSAVENGEVKDILVKEYSPAADKLVTGASEKSFGYPAFNGDADKWIVAAEYLTVNSDGVVTNVKLYGDEYFDGCDFAGWKWATGTVKAESGTVGLGASDKFGYSDSTVVVRYDYDAGKFISENNISGIKNDKNDKVLGIVDTGSLTGICYIDINGGSGEKPTTGGDTPTPGTYSVTVKVDNKKDETLSKTGLKEGEKFTAEYTVPTGKVATYDGKTYNAGQKITIEVTIAKADVTVTITTREEGIGQFTILGDKVPVNYKVIDAGSDTVIQFWIENASWPGYVPQDGKIKGIAHTEIAGAATRDIAGDGDNDTATTIDLEYSKKTSVLISSWKFNTAAGMTVVEDDKTAAGTNSFKADSIVVEVKTPTGYENFINTTSTTKKINNAASQSINVVLSALAGSVTNDVKFSTTGLKSDVTGQATAGNTTIAVASSSAEPKGTEKVVVTLTGMDKLTSGVVLTGLSATALGTGATNLGYTGKLSDDAKAYTLAIAPSKTTCVTGETVVLTATLSNNLLKASEKVGLKVTATVCGQEVEFVFANNGTTTAAATDTANVKATASDTITVADLKFEDIEPPTIQSVTAIDLGTADQFDAGDQIIITFSAPVVKTSVTPTVTGTSATTTLTNATWDTASGDANGTVVTLTVATAAPPADGKLNIAANVQDGETGVFNISAIQYELPGGAGKFTPTLKLVTTP